MVDGFLQPREPVAAFLIALVKLGADRVQLVTKRRDLLATSFDLRGPDVEILGSTVGVGFSIGERDLALQEIDADRDLRSGLPERGSLGLPRFALGLPFGFVCSLQFGEALVRRRAHDFERIGIGGALGDEAGEFSLRLRSGGVEGLLSPASIGELGPQPGGVFALGFELGPGIVDGNGGRDRCHDRCRGQRRCRQNRRRCFGSGYGHGLEADIDVEGAEREPVAVLQIGPADADAVKKKHLGGRESAKMDAAGMASEQTEDGRQRGAGDAEIAAGDGADQEIDLIEPVRHGSAGLVHLQPDRRQRFGARHLPLLGRPLFPGVAGNCQTNSPAGWGGGVSFQLAFGRLCGRVRATLAIPPMAADRLRFARPSR